MADGKTFPVKLLQELYEVGTVVEKELFLWIRQTISSWWLPWGTAVLYNCGRNSLSSNVQKVKEEKALYIQIYHEQHLSCRLRDLELRFCGKCDVSISSVLSLMLGCSYKPMFHCWRWKWKTLGTYNVDSTLECKGTLLFKFLNHEEMVNAECYCTILQHLKEANYSNTLACSQRYWSFSISTNNTASFSTKLLE